MEDQAIILARVRALFKEMHSYCIYHMDIRPENIFRSPSGNQLKVFDFDMAGFLKEDAHPDEVFSVEYLEKGDLSGALVDCEFLDPLDMIPNFLYKD